MCVNGDKWSVWRGAERFIENEHDIHGKIGNVIYVRNVIHTYTVDRLYMRTLIVRIIF